MFHFRPFSTLIAFAAFAGLLGTACGTSESADISVSASGSPRPVTESEGPVGPPVGAAEQRGDALAQGTLSRLLFTRPMLEAARIAVPPQDFESILLRPDAHLVRGTVVAVDLEAEHSIGESWNLLYRITVDGEWTDVHTGETHEGERTWRTLAWGGPEDSRSSVESDLRGEVEQVQIGGDVVLVTVPDPSGASVDVMLGLLDDGDGVVPVTVGGAGALEDFTNLDDAEAAIRSAVSP